MGRAAKGRSIANILEFKRAKHRRAIRVLSKSGERRKTRPGNSPASFLRTKQAAVKKTALEDFANVRKGGSSYWH